MAAPCGPYHLYPCQRKPPTFRDNFKSVLHSSAKVERIFELQGQLIRMLQAVIELFFGFIFDGLISMLWWLILFPVVWLVSLPFILTIALFRTEPYGFAVTKMLYSVHFAWRDLGLMF
jgi:hypothetical protein